MSGDRNSVEREEEGGGGSIIGNREDEWEFDLGVDGSSEGGKELSIFQKTHFLSHRRRDTRKKKKKKKGLGSIQSDSIEQEW